MVNTNQLGLLAKLKLVESLAELALRSLYRSGRLLKQLGEGGEREANPKESLLLTLP